MNPSAPTLSCPACGRINEPPFLFCTQCNHPLIKLGVWRVALNLGAGFCIFLLTYLLQDGFANWIPWKWTFYLIYCMVFAEVAFWMVRGLGAERWLLIRWWLPALAGFMLYFQYRFSVGSGIGESGSGIGIDLIAEIPNTAANFPLLFYPALAAVLCLFFLPALFGWSRRYGWINAYRILAMTFILLALIGVVLLRLTGWVYAQDFSPQWTSMLTPLMRDAAPRYSKAFGLVGLFLGRLLIFELFIHAAIRGYAKASKVRLAVPAARGEGGFSRALTMIVIQLRRFVLTLENTMHAILGSLRELAIDLAKVARDTLREIIAPLIAVVTAGWAIFWLTTATDTYIAEGAERALVSILASVALTLSALTLFIGCKTPLRWGRLIANLGQLGAWLLPNLMIFFLLMSLTLAASASLINEPGEELLPYHVGNLTKGVGGLLMLMVIYMGVRKWRQIAPADGLLEDEAAPDQPAPAVAAGPALRERIAPTGSWASKAIELGDQAAAAARTAGKALGDKVSGKPAIVDRLEELTGKRAQKEMQMETLKSMKASLGAESYDQLRLQYQSELRQIAEQHEATLLETHRRLIERRTELGELERQIGENHTRMTETERLEEARILEAAPAKKKKTDLRTILKTLEVRRSACQQQIAFLEGGLPKSQADNPDQ